MSRYYEEIRPRHTKDGGISHDVWGMIIEATNEVDRLRAANADLLRKLDEARKDGERLRDILTYLGYEVSPTDTREGDRILIDEDAQTSVTIRRVPGGEAAKDASELSLLRSDFERMEWIEEQRALTFGHVIGTPESPPFRSRLLRTGLPSRVHSFGGDTYRAAIDQARSAARTEREGAG
jgi:hypothetical protein